MYCIFSEPVQNTVDFDLDQDWLKEFSGILQIAKQDLFCDLCSPSTLPFLTDK